MQYGTYYPTNVAYTPSQLRPSYPTVEGAFLHAQYINSFPFRCTNPDAYRYALFLLLYIYPRNVHANVIRHLDCCCEVLSMLLAIFSQSEPSLSVQTNIFATRSRGSGSGSGFLKHEPPKLESQAKPDITRLKAGSSEWDRPVWARLARSPYCLEERLLRVCCFAPHGLGDKSLSCEIKLYSDHTM